ncbi:hypothetical protein BC835DRAFT_1305415 [Cytidiella melzeri]|nr:hypothetical protein BC835DRAFT_1305415 [Cytidiella melzeri]
MPQAFVITIQQFKAARTQDSSKPSVPVLSRSSSPLYRSSAGCGRLFSTQNPSYCGEHSRSTSAPAQFKICKSSGSWCRRQHSHLAVGLQDADFDLKTQARVISTPVPSNTTTSVKATAPSLSTTKIGPAPLNRRHRPSALEDWQDLSSGIEDARIKKATCPGIPKLRHVSQRPTSGNQFKSQEAVKTPNTAHLFKIPSPAFLDTGIIKNTTPVFNTQRNPVKPPAPALVKDN